MGDIPQDRLWTLHLKIIATVTKRRPTRPQYDGPALPWRLRRRGLSMASLNALTLNVASLSRRSSIIYHIHLSLASLGQNTSVRNPARAAYPRPLRGARSTSRYYGPEQQHHLRVLHIAHLDVMNVDISALFEPRELHDGRASPLTPQASRPPNAGRLPLRASDSFYWSAHDPPSFLFPARNTPRCHPARCPSLASPSILARR